VNVVLSALLQSFMAVLLHWRLVLIMWVLTAAVAWIVAAPYAPAIDATVLHNPLASGLLAQFDNEAYVDFKNVQGGALAAAANASQLVALPWIVAWTLLSIGAIARLTDGRRFPRLLAACGTYAHRTLWLLVLTALPLWGLWWVNDRLTLWITDWLVDGLQRGAGAGLLGWSVTLKTVLMLGLTLLVLAIGRLARVRMVARDEHFVPLTWLRTAGSVLRRLHLVAAGLLLSTLASLARHRDLRAADRRAARRRGAGRRHGLVALRARVAGLPGARAGGAALPPRGGGQALAAARARRGRRGRRHPAGDARARARHGRVDAAPSRATRPGAAPSARTAARPCACAAAAARPARRARQARGAGAPRLDPLRAARVARAAAGRVARAGLGGARAGRLAAGRRQPALRDRRDARPRRPHGDGLRAHHLQEHDEPADERALAAPLRGGLREHREHLHARGRCERGDRRGEAEGGYIDVRSVRRADGADLGAATTIDDTLMRIDLGAPLAPGAETSVRIEWVTRFPRTVARMGWNGPHLDGMQWYPKLCVLGDAGWDQHQFHSRGEFFGEYGSYEVTFKLPPELPRGRLRGHGRAGRHRGGADGRVLRYTAARVHDFAFCADPNVVRFERAYEEPTTGRPIDIVYLCQPYAVPKAEQVLSVVEDALHDSAEWWLPYPYERIVVDGLPHDQGGGMEYPMLFTTSQRFPAHWDWLVELTEDPPA
jgi:hypothetical protein